MTDDIKRLERKIEELNERLLRVEERVLAAEKPAPEVFPETPRRNERAAAVRAHPAAAAPASVYITLTGRSLIVLGGAFFLRWLTQSGTLPQALGIALGMVYALLWMVLADISGGRDRRISAIFYGITAAFIAFPLLVEATTTFHYLNAVSGAASLIVFIILGLMVAARRKLESLAWIVTLPVIPLVFLLAVRTATMVPFLLCLEIIGFVTLWLGYLRRWQFLATVMAWAANLGLAIMVIDRYMSAYRPHDYQPTLRQALGLLFGFIALYFGSYCFRVFKRKRTITPLEISQTLVAVVIGLGGATLFIHYERHSMLPLGISCLILSIACYTAAYGFLPRRQPNRRNFLFFTLLALAMGLLGCELVFQRSTTGLVFSAIALVAGITARPISSPILFIHGSVYLIMATVRSHLLAVTAHGFIGASADIGEWANAAVLFAFATTMLYLWLPRPAGRVNDMYLGRRAVDLFLFVAVLALGGVLVCVIAKAISAGIDHESYQRFLASTRTGVLALAAVLTARYNRRTRFQNLAWLVYAILALAAVKLLLEDVAAGGAATLFLSFGMYGGALILAPRFLLRAGKPAVS